MPYSFLTDDEGDRSDYDRYMDGLVMRISQHLDGESSHNVACATAVIAAISLKYGYEDRIEREEMFNKLLGIMGEIIDSADDLDFTLDS